MKEEEEEEEEEEARRRRFLLEILVNAAVKPLFIGPFPKTLLITVAAQVSSTSNQKMLREVMVERALNIRKRGRRKGRETMASFNSIYLE